MHVWDVARDALGMLSKLGPLRRGEHALELTRAWNSEAAPKELTLYVAALAVVYPAVRALMAAFEPAGSNITRPGNRKPYGYGCSRPPDASHARLAKPHRTCPPRTLDRTATTAPTRLQPVLPQKRPDSQRKDSERSPRRIGACDLEGS